MVASYLHCSNHIFWHADLTRTYMPPKKSKMAAPRLPEEREIKKVDSANFEKNDGRDVGEKRKKSTSPNEAVKAAKTEPLLTPDPKVANDVLKFLLADAAVPFTRPAGAEPIDADERTYFDLLTPFEELLCAVVLSRPISHRLGIRTIRTLLNEPYSFHDAETIKKAGPEKVRHAFDDARTQHKEKGAEEIRLLADAVLSNDWHNDLSELRAKAKYNVAEEREILRKNVKGLGPTGLDIFFRRVQWQWEEAYPFIDSRTQQALGKLGLPTEAQELRKMMEDDWGRFEKGRTVDMEEDRRRAFVVVCETALGANLERKIGEVLKEVEAK